MKKVLIVDDNVSITKMLSKWLTAKGYEVTVSNDGKNGLTMILENKFNMVLLDLSMPEFTGYDVVDELEKAGKLSEEKIVIFTASTASDEDINKLIERGVHSCLRKPVDLDVLKMTVESSE
ncbi:MAG: response regulator [Nitrosopumilales archaeon CG15_BIG_FIL_POST_REV_8_21_14_020_33_23]|nr:MAG: response regulator [Nitrosopumilales archaeon CG15_BIG_FIL_POST_REV_8_21_14_020_33_23]